MSPAFQHFSAKDRVIALSGIADPMGKNHRRSFPDFFILRLVSELA
jgi:hypothetical protein